MPDPRSLAVHRRLGGKTGGPAGILWTESEDYGFNDRETRDFLDFWIPLLTDAPNYQIFLQYTEMVNQVIKLRISPRPEKVLRLHYVIVQAEDNIVLLQSGIPAVERHGFCVTECGVVLNQMK